MSNSGKVFRQFASGSLVGIGSTSVLDRALEAQLSIKKLTAFGILDDGKFLRLQMAMDVATGRSSALDALSSKHMLLIDQVKAIGSVNQFDTTAFRGSHETAAKLSALQGHRFGNGLDDRLAESIRRLTATHAELTASKVAILGIGRDMAGALARTSHWANVLTGSTVRDYAKLLGIGNRYAKQLEALNLAVGSIAAATAGLGCGSPAARAVALSGGLAGLGATGLKMSLFAGSLDVLGPGAGANQAAYAALLGDYSTPTMLDRTYWRDPRERARYYRDQEVDEGLIDADNAATVAVLIDSGVVEGQRTCAGTMTAVFEAGPVKVRITASRPKLGAFRAINTFENCLRNFVAHKLLATQGPNWFKQRVPGDIVMRAKDRHREAMRAGEASLDLIHYTDLGDLIGVITRKDNWTELFEPVFQRAESLRVDLERLTANRRPTMHSRPVDTVQLCEIVFTIRRLVGWMKRDPDWEYGWDDDS